MAPSNFFYLVSGWAAPFLLFPLLGPVVGTDFVYGATHAAPWPTSGLVTGIVLRQEKSSIEWKHIILMSAS
jgi:hypothetical protein